MTEKTGQEWVDIIAAHPTMDELLNRSPFAIPYTDEELMRMVEINRAERALFTIKEQKARDKKAGVIEDADAEKADTAENAEQGT